MKESGSCEIHPLTITVIWIRFIISVAEEIIIALAFNSGVRSGNIKRRGAACVT